MKHANSHQYSNSTRALWHIDSYPKMTKMYTQYIQGPREPKAAPGYPQDRGRRLHPTEALAWDAKVSKASASGLFLHFPSLKLETSAPGLLWKAGN